MIHPVFDANGVPDLTRLNEWTATCDHCTLAASAADIDPWLAGPRVEQAIYCPDCIPELAARLIDPLFRPAGLPGLVYDLTQQARRLPHRARPTARRLARTLPLPTVRRHGGPAR
ncbi:hypothetical protein GCM10009678_05000 [Actinomadura kijaniata]|uniref:Uncharacterized protein n=1 Tax=Actinomadura namibiensis TaxID=182080 RepID=A0A7W3QNU6_ACTNM|nr:hypothetical protein [Actinomadura namibiensis]MBA8953936.1 hypothetical protein [Actinomadura namibiensis]